MHADLWLSLHMLALKCLFTHYEAAERWLETHILLSEDLALK